MEVKRDDTIEYRPRVVADSEYMHVRLFQQTGSTDVPIAGTGGIATIELPVIPMNLGKSFLNFTQTIPAQAGFANAFRDTPPISRLELYTRGGQYLMDVTNFNNIYQAFGQRTKKIEDFHGSDDAILVKRTPLTAPAAVVVPALFGDLGAARTSVAAVNTALTSVSSQYAVDNMDIKKFATSAAAAGALVVNWRIEMSELYNTALSLDKSVYLGEVLNLRITFAGIQEHGFGSTSTSLAGVTVSPIALVAGPTITDLNFYLAQEMNPMVVNDLVQTVRSTGMEILIPYTHVYKTVQTGTSHAVSLRLSNGHGVSLERIYTIPLTGAEEKDTRYVSNAALMTSFYTILDSKRLQQFDVLGGTTKDYLWLRKDESKDRVVSIKQANSTTNFAWSDSWCRELECAKHQLAGGLDLSVERKYDFYATGNANTNYYQAAVCQKILRIGAGGVQVS
jgi:hypothetical protein